jgi:hypothetical protein
MKTQLKILVKTIAAAALGFCVASHAIAGADTKPAFIVVMDDSGVLTDPARAKNQKLLLLAQLKALQGVRKYAKANLTVISTSFGRPVWVGSIADLSNERAKELVSKIEADPKRCNQLEASFKAIQTTVKQLEQRGANSIYIHFFSSLIATPSPCGDLKIALPQLPVPVNFTEVFTASNAVTSISLLYANPHQLGVYRSALEPVADWANSNGKSFAIMDVEESEHQLRQGLLGVSK